MGKGKSSSVKRGQNGQREVTPDVHKDKVASNLLNFKKPEYQGVSKNNKARDRSISKGKIPQKKKKERVYTEKELGIPKLNTSLDPVGVKVKGKKGKKFVDDTTMQLILAEVQQESNEAQASKLERARQLEVIRETKRKEMEERERKEKEKVENKKRELKKKKGSNNKQPSTEDEPPRSAPRAFGKKPAKKRVSFAD